MNQIFGTFDLGEMLNLSFYGYRLQTIIKSTEDLYLIFLISVPLSLLLYLIFSKYRHWLLVDLGFHKWLIK